MKLKLAKDTEKYWKAAATWASQQDWAYYQHDRFPAIKGLAEFLANQEGETIFEGWAGREYKKVEL